MQNVHCDRLPSPACSSLRKNLAFVEHVFGTKRAQSVAETTQAFITFMDALKLKLRAKDQLHPLLGDLMGAYGKAGGAGEGRGKLVGWSVHGEDRMLSWRR